MRLRLLGALALTVATPTTSQALESSRPATAGQIERFRRALPPGDAEQIEAYAAQVRGALFVANPGRESEVAPIATAYLACVNASTEKATEQQIRETARKLNSDEIEHMIAFYSNDVRRYDGAVARYQAGKPLSPPDRAILQRVSDDRVVQKWTKMFQLAVKKLAISPQVIEEMTACSIRERDDLIAANLNLAAQE